MTETDKTKRLRRYKALATGLFLMMTLVFVAMSYLEKQESWRWIGYVRAFSEAAMVGALADWFAVTALFHHPLGLPIPHTNIIANSKRRIGDNLGDFVVKNFLSEGSIRPYIEKIKISRVMAKWLSKEKNQEALLQEFFIWAEDIIGHLNEKKASSFIYKKIIQLSDGLNMSRITGKILLYISRKAEFQEMITFLASEVRLLVLRNNNTIRQGVRAQSYRFIPGFVDRRIADKITLSLAAYFEEVANDTQHPLRIEIEKAVESLAGELENTDRWEQRLQEMKNSFLYGDKIHEYTADVWKYAKSTMLGELKKEDSAFGGYIKRNISRMAAQLEGDSVLKDKTDRWFRTNAYRLVLRNSSRVGDLISDTIGGWEDQQLSRKLELEVGKDLQFIRVNGTLVGGLVGLVIYTLVHLFL